MNTESEYQAMHGENLLSSLLRDDVERNEEERKRLNEEAERAEGTVGTAMASMVPHSRTVTWCGRLAKSCGS